MAVESWHRRVTATAKRLHEQLGAALQTHETPHDEEKKDWQEATVG